MHCIDSSVMYKALDTCTRETIRRNTLIDLKLVHTELKQTGGHTNYFFELSNRKWLVATQCQTTLADR